MLTIIGTGEFFRQWTMDNGRWKKNVQCFSIVHCPSSIVFSFFFLVKSAKICVFHLRKSAGNASIITLLFLCILTSCHGVDKKEETPAEVQRPKAQVTATSVSFGDMNEQVPLSAITAYVQRNMMTAPIPCFLLEVKVKLGQSVKKGEVLYVLESKEHKALGDAFKDDPSLAHLGIITVQAPINGIVTVLDRQQVGDYVTEGNPLCTITENNSVVFQLNVPYEYNRLTHVGESYTIVLPDKRQIRAKLTLPLTTVMPTAQTQQFWLKPESEMFFPEGLIATVMLTLNHKSNTQTLPKECILSDELLKDFWVMKMINDSTAVKTPVKLGMRNLQAVEITEPKFDVKDKILSDGNYGLSDTAAVKIMGDK